MNVGQKLTLKIERLSFGGGRGVARHHNFVIFVPYVLPEEEVLVEIVKLKKNFAEAHLLKILVPAPKRRVPPCPYFEKCGGCNWQHIDYEKQVEIKHGLYKHFFVKFKDV